MRRSPFLAAFSFVGATVNIAARLPVNSIPELASGGLRQVDGTTPLQRRNVTRRNLCRECLRPRIAKFFDDFVNVPRKAHRLSGSACALLALPRSIPASVVSP